MPIEIEDVTTSVHVEPSSGEGTPDHADETGVQAQQRWQALAARSLQLAERTAAWRFDD